MQTAVTIVWLVLGARAVFSLLTVKREPPSTIAWLIVVFSIPIGGAVLFFIFGPQRLERKASKRREGILKLLGSHQSDFSKQPDWQGKSLQLEEGDLPILKLAQRVSEYQMTTQNRIDLLIDPQAALSRMQDEIDGAKKFVHLQYYIFESDEVTRQLFDSLQRAARRGVEVRVLYDAFGSLSLKRIYFFPLTRAGVKIAGFMPLSLVPQRMNFNFRNHRKILLVDGNVAFTGGTNIGRSYLGHRTPHQWHDYSIAVSGPVCGQLEDVFAKDWYFTTQEDLFEKGYYPTVIPLGSNAVQVLESGPDSPFRVLHQSIFSAIMTAQKEILLMTPYFIPDPSIMDGLIVASLRGVKVRLILPSKSDAPFVRLAARSFYDELLGAGIEIFEFKPRILHAKLLTIDGRWTIVGSANMDIRSFRLNFELNLLIFGSEFGEKARKMFNDDLSYCEAVTHDEFSRRAFPHRILENSSRLLSPLL